MDQDNSAMIDITTGPDLQHWTTAGQDDVEHPLATAAAVNELLARLEVSEIPSTMVPHLAAGRRRVGAPGRDRMALQLR